MAQSGGSILILDDDADFRNILVAILEPRGFRCVQASSPDEASALFSQKDTVLAVVDYRLPKMDGMSWITKLRDAGRNVPVIFCSALPCDAKTFNWLRNILRVSLIVQKPINHEAFIQQVESLLPNYQKFTGTSEGVAAVQKSDAETAEESLEAAGFRERIDRKARIEKALEDAKIQYFEQLDKSWNSLTKLIDERNNDPSNFDAVDGALNIAHKIRGSAGSLGLHHISELAGKLEDLLTILDPNPSPDQEVIWSEIIRAVARGTESIAQTLAESDYAEVEKHRKRLLVLSQNREFLSALDDSEIKKVYSVTTAETPAGLSMQLRKGGLDCVILDASLDTGNDATGLLAWSQEVRGTRDNEALPLALFCPDAEPSDSDMLFIGASKTIGLPVESNRLKDLLDELVAIRTPVQPRILVVDDDEVLCNFVSRVLTDERMVVQTETNPINVLDDMDEFKPDLVLLDVIMPGLTGYEVCRGIREDARWAKTPVVFCTSKTSSESRTAAFAVGANDFVTKPVLATELLTRINGQLIEVERQARSARKDIETGMLNGDGFLVAANDMLNAHKARGETMSLALISVDDYEDLTIVQGPMSAKEVGLRLGQLIRQRFKAEDLRGRWSDAGYILAVAETRRQVLAEALELLQEEFSASPFSGGAFRFAASFSAGLADSADDGDTVEQLVRSTHHRLRTARQEKTGVIAATG